MLFPVAAFVFFTTVTWALGVSTNLALFRLHRPFLVAISTGAGCRVITVPIRPSGHYYTISSKSLTSILQLSVYPYK